MSITSHFLCKKPTKYKCDKGDLEMAAWCPNIAKKQWWMNLLFFCFFLGWEARWRLTAHHIVNYNLFDFVLKQIPSSLHAIDANKKMAMCKCLKCVNV